MRSSSALSWLIERPIAHRGLHDIASAIVENTESAFASAISHGYGIECDVQLAGDGEAMVFHDHLLGRLTHELGLVRAHSSLELKGFALRVGGDRMQTLPELLEQVDGRVPLVIELKSVWDGHVALAARAVECLQGYKGPAALMSFDPVLVAAVREADPRVPRGIVGDRVVHDAWMRLPLPRRLALRHMSHLDETDPDFLSYDVNDLPSPPSRLFRALRRPIICWTVRTPAQVERGHRWADQITFEGFLPPIPNR